MQLRMGFIFDAGSETIPTIPAANTSSEGVEPAQEPIVSDLETIPDEGDTPPTANEPGTEAGDTVNNTAAVPNNDGKTQEAAENQTPAADTDTAPADPALTNKTPADTSDTAARQTMPSTQRKPRRQNQHRARCSFC